MTDQTWPIEMSILAQTVGPRATTLLPQLIPIYIEDADLLINRMAEALQAGNPSKLQQAAHRLQGNSASLGAVTIAQFAKELERLGKLGDLVTAVQPLTKLSEEYNKVKLALLDMISRVE